MHDVDILMIGNFAKDKIIVDGVEEIASGSGVYFGSVVIRRLGYRVAVATRLHPDDFPRLDEIKAEGVEVYAMPAAGTSGIANYYKSSNMETRICQPIGFGGKYSLSEIPNIPVKMIMITPLFAGEIDLPLLQALAERAPLALDVQGFIRVPVQGGLDFQPWSEMREGLTCVTYLKVDRAEAEALTGSKDLVEAARLLSKMGPMEIILTESAGVTVFADGETYFSPFHPRSLAGRTGRGDTCFSTYVACRLDHNPKIACHWAGEVTTLKQEKPGPWRGSTADLERIAASAG